MARGLFAELNRQLKIAAREQAQWGREQERARKTAIREAEREQKAEVRALNAFVRDEKRERKAEERAKIAAIRDAERARKARERAATQRGRTSAAKEKKREKEVREAHVAKMQAEVEKRNAELAIVYNDLELLLAATLDIDDFVDLDSLRRVVEHPPFDREDLEAPLPSPPPIEDPPEPEFEAPPEPAGLGKLFGKKKFEEAKARAIQDHASSLTAWKVQLEANKDACLAAASNHADQEKQRLAELARERERYEKECAHRIAEVEEHNASIETLKANLSYGAVEAVQEYVSIVLANSIYPDHLSIEHRFEFDNSTAELKLRVLVPGPDKISTTKAFKYTKATDQISETDYSMMACKKRYAGIVEQVALRSIHEVFEADRRGVIKLISLEVGTETIDPATGLEAYIPFIAAGAERESFLEIDLSNVIPLATLKHLGAAISKNPFELVPADISGIRKS